MARPFDSESFGRALQWLRYESDLSFAETARRAGISKAQLAAFENGDRQPSLTALDDLLDAVNADLTDLQGALSVARSRNFRKRGSLPAPAPRSHVSPDLKLLMAVMERPGLARAVAHAFRDTPAQS